MEDNEYSFGGTEDSSSRVSYDQGSEENGQGGDSSMAAVMEGGFSGRSQFVSSQQTLHFKSLKNKSVIQHTNNFFGLFFIPVESMATRWETQMCVLFYTQDTDGISSACGERL